MELKNMNGFCELSENTMMEIDGGYRFASGSGSDSVSYSNATAAATAGIVFVGVTAGAPLAPLVAVGVTVGLTIWSLV